MEKDKRLLTPDDIAEELQLPKSTIYKLCSDGEIPAAKIGKHWRFDRARLDAWLAERFERQESKKGDAVSANDEDRADAGQGESTK